MASREIDVLESLRHKVQVRFESLTEIEKYLGKEPERETDKMRDSRLAARYAMTNALDMVGEYYTDLQYEIGKLTR